MQKKTDQDLTDNATFPTVEPEAALRQGPRPTFYQANTKAKAVDIAVEQVQQLVMLGYSPSDIAILYRYKPQKDAALFDSMLKPGPAGLLGHREPGNQSQLQRPQAGGESHHHTISPGPGV